MRMILKLRRMLSLIASPRVDRGCWGLVRDFESESSHDVRRSRTSCAEWLWSCTSMLGIRGWRGHVDEDSRNGRLAGRNSPHEVRFATVGHSVASSDHMQIEETIKKESTNMILLDVAIPKRNGFQACRDLKNHTSYSQI